MDWTVIEVCTRQCDDTNLSQGMEQGISQIGSTLTESGSVIVLNFPLEIVYKVRPSVGFFLIHLKSVNIFGWPQLTISVYGPDFVGRDVVRGYLIIT